MPDNLGYTPGSGVKVATRDVTYSGEAAQLQVVALGTVSGADDAKSVTDVDLSNPLPIQAVGELLEAMEAMRMAIQSLNRTIGMAQVNPLTGRMLVDGSGVTQPVSGTVTATGTIAATQSGAWNITNLATIGGQVANSVIPALERGAADNLRKNITTS
jgi:hypothetical protein